MTRRFTVEFQITKKVLVTIPDDVVIPENRTIEDMAEEWAIIDHLFAKTLDEDTQVFSITELFQK